MESKWQAVYRDNINNPIEVGDVVMYTSIKQCKGLMIGRVRSFTPKRVRVINLETKQSALVATKHCVVITQQINHNMSEPVDGFFDDVRKTPAKNLGQTARSYLIRRGFVQDEDGKFKHKDEDELQRMIEEHREAKRLRKLEEDSS